MSKVIRVVTKASVTVTVTEITDFEDEPSYLVQAFISLASGTNYELESFRISEESADQAFMQANSMANSISES